MSADLHLLTNLVTLNAANSGLTGTLDVHGITTMTSINISGCASMTGLDVSGCSSLTTLDAWTGLGSLPEHVDALRPGRYAPTRPDVGFNVADLRPCLNGNQPSDKIARAVE